MKITQITYGRTFNNDNYESSRFDVTADLSSTDDPDTVMEELLAKVDEFRELELS